VTDSVSEMTLCYVVFFVMNQSRVKNYDVSAACNV